MAPLNEDSLKAAQMAYWDAYNKIPHHISSLEHAIRAYLEHDDGWLDISLAPKNKYIEILPEIGLPFIGDIWDCSMRNDIKEDKLARLRCWDGHIATMPVTNRLKWRELRLPTPPKGQSDDKR